MVRRIFPQARRTQLGLVRADRQVQTCPRIWYKQVLQRQLHRVHPQRQLRGARQKYWTPQQTIAHTRPLGRVQHAHWRTRLVFSAAMRVPQKDLPRKRNTLPHPRHQDDSSNLPLKSVRSRKKGTSRPHGIHSLSRTGHELEKPLPQWTAIRVNGLWVGFAINAVVLWRFSGGRARLVGR